MVPIPPPAKSPLLEKPGPEPPIDIFQEPDGSPSDANGESDPDPMDDVPYSMDTTQPGSLSPSEGSREYLDMIKWLVNALGVQ